RAHRHPGRWSGADSAHRHRPRRGLRGGALAHAPRSGPAVAARSRHGTVGRESRSGVPMGSVGVPPDRPGRPARHGRRREHSRRGGRSRQLAVSVAVTVVYFWAMVTLVVPLLRYMVPAAGLLFVLLPVLLVRARAGAPTVLASATADLRA